MVTFLPTPSYAKKFPKEPREQQVYVQVNKTHEWLKAMGHCSCIVTYAFAAYQMLRVILLNKVSLERSDNSNVHSKALSYCASVIGFTTLVKLTTSDIIKCFESIKKATSGYSKA